MSDRCTDAHRAGESHTAPSVDPEPAATLSAQSQRVLQSANSSPVSRRILASLLTIVFLGVLMRAYRLGEPLVGRRQTDTAAIARNFYEGSMNILYPQVDWRGNSPGYVESEFPIYTFALAILYHLFGVHDWLGRALSVAAYVLSALLLFHLARRLFNESVALLATVFYSFMPLSYVFTRTYQPDALMALCSLAGVYYFWLWTEKDRWMAFAISTVATSLAILIKPTNLYLGLPLLYLSQRKFGLRLFRKPALWFFAVAAIVPALLWYYHAYGLWKTYGNTFGVFGGWVKLGIPGAGFLLSLGKQLFLRLLFWIATPIGLLLLLVGFFAKPPQRNYLLHWWAIGFGISVLIAAPGHREHNYYQLPIVTVLAAWMAFGAAIVWEKRIFSQRLTRMVVAAACLFTIGFSIWELSFGRVSDWVRISQKDRDRLAFAERIERLTEPDATVIFVIPDGSFPALYQHRTAQGEYLQCDPVDFYRSHRKGWSLDDTQATPEFLETLRQRGAKYVATAYSEIFRRHPDLKAAIDRSYTPVEVTPKWAIYRLDSPSALRSIGSGTPERH